MGVAQATECVSGGTLHAAAAASWAADGQPFALGQTLPLGAAAVVHGGEAVFLDVVDADRNRDAAVVDRIELVVTAQGGDRETIVLDGNGRRLGPVRGLRADARDGHRRRRLRARSAARHGAHCALCRPARLRRYGNGRGHRRSVRPRVRFANGRRRERRTRAPRRGGQRRTGRGARRRRRQRVSRRARHGPARHRLGRHRLRVPARRLPLSARRGRRLSARRRAARPLQRAVDGARSALASAAGRAVHAAAGIVRRRADGAGTNRAGRRHSARPDGRRAVRRQEHGARRRRDRRLRPLHRHRAQRRRRRVADERRRHRSLAARHALSAGLGSPRFGHERSSPRSAPTA